MEREIKKTQLTRRKETMRKLAIFALVLGLVIAFAVPAMAFRIEGPKDTKFYFGGRLLLDTGAWSLSKERTVAYGVVNQDRTQFFMNIPQHSMITGVVEAGNTGFLWEIRYGRDNLTAHEQGDTASTTPNIGAADKNNRLNYLEAAKFYGWYKFGNCRIMAGKGDQWLTSVGNGQNLGIAMGHILLYGWGNFYDDRSAQIRFEQNINKSFSYAISAVQPAYGDVNVATAVPGVTRNVDSYAQFPLLAVKFTMNFGPVTLFLPFAWSQVEWDDLPNGYDNSVTYWLAGVQGRVTAGAFTATFGGNWSQNQAIFNGAYNNVANPYSAPIRGADGTVKNGRNLAGFIDLAFKAGTFTPHLFFGYDYSNNTDAFKEGNDYNARYAVGVAADWAVSPNFLIRPEFAYYNYGERPGDRLKPSLGTEWLLGMQFAFLF
jgi:hypothetical protein